MVIGQKTLADKEVVFMNEERKLEINTSFVPPRLRPVQPGLSDFEPDRPVVDIEVVTELPGRILVGRVDTTRGTIK